METSHNSPVTKPLLNSVIVYQLSIEVSYNKKSAKKIVKGKTNEGQWKKNYTITSLTLFLAMKARMTK